MSTASSAANFQHLHYNISPPYTRPDDVYLPAPQSPSPYPLEYSFTDANILQDCLALLQQPVSACMNPHQAYHFTAPSPNIRIQTSTPTPCGDFDLRQDSVIANPGDLASWPMYQQTSMGAPDASTQHTHGVKRARTHQRTPSASTVNSNGPQSPFAGTSSYPHIANTDYSPNSPASYYADTTSFSKHPPTPSRTPTGSGFAGYMPSQAAHPAGNAHQAMQLAMIDQHHNQEDYADFPRSSRHSMSSYNGNDSPATPLSSAGGDGNTDSKPQPGLMANGEAPTDLLAGCFDDCLLFDPAGYTGQTSGMSSLYRTESQAYQDELYNPPQIDYTSTPITSATSRHSNGHLLQPHNNLITQRLATANQARSQSPLSTVSQSRSPFRDSSPLAPPPDKRFAVMSTAAGMRQQQQEQAAQQEVANHQRPQLQREPTKTISPKDALLDYNEQEQPLFQDNIPTGYQKHTGGTQQWPSNDFVTQPGAAFGNLQTPSQQSFANFRATSADGYSGPDFSSWVSLPPQAQNDSAHQSQIHNASYANNHYYNTPAQRMNGTADDNPPFPANLTSMESSISENGPPVSSQDSVGNTSAPQRPADTRANTGTYTCTYHGCTQRFDSHQNLQKHKRDFHRSQQSQPKDEASASPPASGSDGSARSTESPAPSGSGLTSAALLARNSQTGPHKCSRINPSTNKPCNTVFSRPYDLTRHEDTIHNGRKQKVRCPMCREEKTFSRSDALTRHMRVVHPEMEQYGKRGRRGD